MGSQYTPSQKKAIEKYASTRCQMKITLTPEQRTKYQEYAESKGMSVAKMICKFFDDAIANEGNQLYVQKN